MSATTTVMIEQLGGAAAVTFADDELAVAVIRTAPSRRWDKALRCWWIPSSDVEIVARMFDQAGFPVMVTGAPAPSTSPAKVVDPVLSVLELVPERLRAKTIRAFSPAWHPDHDGDHALMVSLNSAVGALEGRR